MHEFELRYAMRKARMDCDELAEKIGESASDVAAWLEGKPIPPEVSLKLRNFIDSRGE